MAKTKYQVLEECFVGFGEGYDRKVHTYSKLESAEAEYKSAANNDYNYWEQVKLLKYTDPNHKECIKSCTIKNMHTIHITDKGAAWVKPTIKEFDGEPSSD